MEERGESEKISNGEMDEKYFYDSYAVIEMLKGNQNYIKYKDFSAILSQWNLAEIYYNSIINLIIGDPNEIFDFYKDAVVEIDDDTLKEAMKFRKENKKKDVSYADCIGYIYAKRHKMKFLTGDKEFEKLSNVEFVK
jgi:uncharacterized protein